MDEQNLWGTPQGVYTTHGLSQCVGRPCCVHNPSDHHMVGWPMIYDHAKLYLALRVCEHGCAHPDPDSLAYFANRQDFSDALVVRLSMHQCDGCCLPETMPESL